MPVPRDGAAVALHLPPEQPRPAVRQLEATGELEHLPLPFEAAGSQEPACFNVQTVEQAHGPDALVERTVPVQAPGPYPGTGRRHRDGVLLPAALHQRVEGRRRDHGHGAIGFGQPATADPGLHGVGAVVNPVPGGVAEPEPALAAAGGRDVAGRSEVEQVPAVLAHRDGHLDRIAEQLDDRSAGLRPGIDVDHEALDRCRDVAQVSAPIDVGAEGVGRGHPQLPAALDRPLAVAQHEVQGRREQRQLQRRVFGRGVLSGILGHVVAVWIGPSRAPRRYYAAAPPEVVSLQRLPPAARWTLDPAAGLCLEQSAQELQSNPILK